MAQADIEPRPCRSQSQSSQSPLDHATNKCLLVVEGKLSSVQFSFISAPPHEQDNKMLRSLCVDKDGVRKRKKQQNKLTL